MSKVKAVLNFAEAYDATSPDRQAEHAALEAEVNLLYEQDEWEEHAIHGAVIAAIYADHVAAELQAENAALRAKVAELEKGREWLPIEGAPTDEDHPYLVLLPKNDVAPFLTMQVTNFEGRAYPDILNGVIDYDDAVTEAAHWMPLPQGVTK